MNPHFQNYRVYSPNPPSPRRSNRPEKSSNLKPTAILLVVFLCVGVYFLNARHTVAQNAERAAYVAETAERQRKQAVLSKEIKELLSAQNENIRFSIALTNVYDKPTLSFGDVEAMDAASTGKLITACLFLKNVETGRYNLNQKLGDASSKNQLKRLIQKSDDEAWVLFNERLGHPALKSYTSSVGISSYDPETGYIMAQDMALLLKKLYLGKLLNPTHTKLLLSYMQNTNYENYITPAVSEGARIYHKVGLTGDQVNDTAIIARGNKAFVLTIFTNGGGTYDWRTRAEIMQKITSSAINAYL